MKRALVTGGSGFIGSEICKMLLSKGISVTSFDNYSRKNIKKIKLPIRYIKGDITKINELKKIKGNFDYIFHLAFINGTKFFYEIPEKVIEVGIRGTFNIVEFAKERGAKEFYLASSSEVYQEPNKIPTSEKETMKVPDAYNPRYSYGSSKMMSEIICINYLKNILKKLIIFRPHNVYGPNMGNEHVIPNFINNIKKLKSKKKYIFIQGTGLETRTFNYIDDFIMGVETLMKKKVKSGTYNIGDKNEITIKRLLKILMNIMNVSLNIKSKKITKGSVKRRRPDIKKISKYGYRPRVNLKDGLKKTVNWYLNNSPNS
jgi:UDP-glucose 4-epimerase